MQKDSPRRKLVTKLEVISGSTCLPKRHYTHEENGDGDEDYDAVTLAACSLGI